jgi:hypothetical protein
MLKLPIVSLHFTTTHKKKVPYLSSRSICYIRIVQTDGGQGLNHPTKNTTMVEPVAGLAAWFFCFEPPHPREPLRKGLTKDNVTGFYIIMLTGQEKNN